MRAPLHASCGDEVTQRLLTVLVAAKTAASKGPKSPATPAEREAALVPPAVGSWLLQRAESVLSAESAPLLFDAIQEGLLRAPVGVRVTVAVQLLALNDSLYVLVRRNIQIHKVTDINTDTDTGTHRDRHKPTTYTPYTN